MRIQDFGLGRLLTSREVAGRFRVDPKTVTRWALAGLVTDVRTPGGEHRYWEAEIKEALKKEADEKEADDHS